MDTLDMQSVYFFRANTNKVDSSKIIDNDFKTFKIKVLVFILSTSFLKRKKRMNYKSRSYKRKEWSTFLDSLIYIVL